MPRVVKSSQVDPCVNEQHFLDEYDVTLALLHTPYQGFPNLADDQNHLSREHLKKKNCSRRSSILRFRWNLGNLYI